MLLQERDIREDMECKVLIDRSKSARLVDAVRFGAGPKRVRDLLCQSYQAIEVETLQARLAHPAKTVGNRVIKYLTKRWSFH